MIARSLALAALAACGTDVVDEESAGVEANHAGLAAAEPAPLDPFILCPWAQLPIANQNVRFTAYGYAGVERGFRIHHGNLNEAAGYLEYKIELLWQVGDCSGTVYYLRFPEHGQTNHAEIEVRSSAGALMGRLDASRGSLPVLYNQSNNPLPTHKRGPFVITNGMVGGVNGMAETVTFTLLDAAILERLPYPAFYNGALPSTTAQEDAIADAHDALIADNDYLYSFFTFHRALEAMSSADRQAVSDAIDVEIDSPGPIHGDPLWEEHHHVDHTVAVGPATAGASFGGFFNGHRNYLGELERLLPEQPGVPPFGRLPSWDPATAVPAELTAGTNNPNGGSDLEAAYKAGNICASFAPSLSGAPTLADRLTEMEDALYDDVDPWHGSVHVGVGGDFGNFNTAASAPIFWPWHKTVDLIWRNWQLCYGAYHPIAYSWDAL